MSRIPATFDRLRQRDRRALIPFITAGDPEPSATLPLMHALVRAGADILELGVPFSDPMADGPVIQRASERALAHGVGLGDVLEMVAAFRRADGDTPVVLMGYANPIEAMGHESFAQRAQEVGVDGVLTVDYPPEECADFAARLTAYGIDPIFLLSPTSREERVAAVARLARGFVYYVSLKGVTGASHLDLQDVKRKLIALKRVIDLPIGVGFGIRDGTTARAVAAFADAVVIGSRIVKAMEDTPRAELEARVEELVRGFRQAMDAPAAVGA
ncbi:tryptophan synthase subunit alpha [Thiobacter aerophilum]|uniref:Tryptophan synthase alpha chain n=1 Tax=Thiobacter aerophilum TaxID=3121275 RepID=A0ABV0EFY1_9BURK